MADGTPNPAVTFKSSAQAVASYIMAAYDPAIKGEFFNPLHGSLYDGGT